MQFQLPEGLRKRPMWKALYTMQMDFFFLLKKPLVKSIV